MDLQRNVPEIDSEILRQSGSILDGISQMLGISRVLHVAPSATDDRLEPAIDVEVANLNGGLFGPFPAQQIPLEAFHLDAISEPMPVSRPRIDSFAPIARPSLPPEPERGQARRPVPWVVGCAIAAGLAGFVATRALVQSTHATQPRGAEVAAAIAPEAVVPTPDQAPSAEPAPAPVALTMAAAAPRSAPRVAAAPPAAARPSAAAAPATAKAPSPEPGAVDTADMRIAIPPLPPKPPVAFDRAAAAVAVAGGGRRAGSCLEAGAGSTAVPVAVTFDPSGSAVSAKVTGGTLVGTVQGGCVAVALRGAHVPAFDGEPVTVATVVHLP